MERAKSASKEHPTASRRPRPAARRVEDAPLALGVLPELLGRQLRIASSLVFKGFTLEVGGLSLTPGSFEAMELLDRNPGIGQTRLADAINLDKSSLVPVLARLLSLGLVERTRPDSDKRAHHLHLTAKGKSTLARIRAYVLRHDAAMSRGMTRAEVETLKTLLKKVALLHGYLAREAEAGDALGIKRKAARVNV